METYIIVNSLAALAQETRLQIFRLLVQAGPAGMAVAAIQEKLGIPNATLSFHLQQLKNAGLANAQRKSTQIIYSANYSAMNELIGYLTENCCQGDMTGCAPAGCCSPNTEKE